MSRQKLFDDSRLPEEWDARVRAELGKDEQLLWVGQPLAGRMARSAIPIMLCGIPWTAFFLFWTAGASGMLFAFGGDGPELPPAGFGAFLNCFSLFGLLFVLIGLRMLTSPYWSIRRGRRSCYALTDRRMILWLASSFGGVETRSYGQAELGKIYRKEYADGSGDLMVERVVSAAYASEGQRSMTRTTVLCLMAIPNVRAVEELLRQSLLTDRQQPPQ